MDFNRSNQPFRATPSPAHTEVAAKDTTAKKGAKKKSFGDLSALANFAILVSTAIVVLGAVILLTRTHNDSQTFIDEDAYQAVDVTSGGSNGDQVYFGKIARVTDRQIVLTNVFYPVANEDSNSVTTLVPFVCSLATPYDQLVLNRDQVAYWYNLQSDSKVTKTIDQYKKDNKNKANCDSLTTGTNTDTNAGTDTTGNNSADTKTPAADNNTDTTGNTPKP